MSAEAPSSETQRPEVNLLSRVINPTRARIIGAIFDNSLLKPKSKLKPDQIPDFKTKVIEAAPESIDFTPVQDASTENRKKYWKGKSFEEQNSEWNGQTWEVIQNMIKPGNPDREEVIKTFKSLSLNPENNGQNEIGLNQEVEKFRATYFEGKSKVKEFVASVAKDCQEEGQVNITLFEKRLKAIENLLGTFGSPDISELVSDYAMSHALLSQKREVKETMTDILVPFVSKPYEQKKTGRLRSFLNNLIPIAGIAALAHLATNRENSNEQQTTTTEGESTGDSQDGREATGDLDAQASITGGETVSDQQGYYESSDNNQSNDQNRDNNDNQSDRPGYVDVGGRDHGDVPRGGTETGGFGGFGDMGAQQGGSSATATDTGGREGREDIGDQDIGPTDQATETGGTTGYVDLGGKDFGSGEPATETGGFAGEPDIGEPDKGEDSGNGNGESNGSDSDGDSGD